jgi:6-phosphogluconolactonase
MPANLVYVGTYTASGRSEGIYVFGRDASSGRLEPRHTVRDVVNPSFLAFDPHERFLFAVNETQEYEGKAQGAVSSFAIDPSSGDLTFLSKQATGGGDPCHLCTDSTGRYLLVANHEHGNVAVLPIGSDGRLGPLSDLRQHEGSGPGPTQQGPHAHFVTTDPTGRFVMVVDKGIDKVMVYRLDTAAGKLVPNDPPYGRLHPGAAPRHIAFHPNGRFAYVNGEADMTITAFVYDGARGAFEELHYLPTLPEGASGRYSTAQIVVEPSGRYVYVSNRGHDTIAMFAIDQTNGRLSAIGHEPTGGRTPRNFNVDPSGTFLYAANQNSDTVVPFRIDRSSGRLTQTGETVEVGSPVCLLFSRG